MKDSDKKVYQNVLLQMATVQADFGCYNEAMSAMDQAISVARENKDKLCLHYCLSWLHQMRLSSSQQMSKHDEEALLGAEASGLEYLKNIARKDDVPGIQVQSLLTEARYHLAKVSSVTDRYVLGLHLHRATDHCRPEYSFTKPST